MGKGEEGRVLDYYETGEKSAILDFMMENCIKRRGDLQ